MSANPLCPSWKGSIGSYTRTCHVAWLSSHSSLRRAKEVCVYTLFSVVVSKLYYHYNSHIYMLGLIWYPSGRFRQQFRPRSLFCVRSLCCLNIWYRKYCLVGDVVNVTCLITGVSSVARCSTTLMVNIVCELTLIYFVSSVARGSTIFIENIVSV